MDDKSAAKAMAELAATRLRMEAGRAARQAARAERIAAKAGADASGQDSEEKKAAKKERAEQAKALTKILVPLASIGAKEALEGAFAKGADQGKAIQRGIGPAVAAINGGHPEVAKWLMGRADHRWADLEGQCGSDAEILAAIRSDDPELCAWIVERRPQQGKREALARRDAIQTALGTAPKAAAWLIGNGLAGPCPKLGASGWDWSRANGMAMAFKAGDMASADAIFAYVEKGFNEGFACKEGPVYSLAGQFVGLALKSDDPDMLAWGLSKSARLAAACFGNIPAKLIERRRGHWVAARDGASRLHTRLAMANTGKLHSTLPMWAACEGACACLELLLGVEAFREDVAKMQRRPEMYFWEQGLMWVGDPAVATLLEGAGYDFDRRTDEGWCHAAAILMEGKPTVKWLEWIGRTKPGQLSAAPAQAHADLAGKDPFGLAAEGRWAPQASQIAKWRSVCEKAAMKSGTARSRATKEVKERAARSRRL